MHEERQPVTGFVETHGTRLYYEMMGEGHPLVFLHGGYMDTRMWDDQFDIFAQSFRVIRYDIRGFGKSLLPQVSYADREDLYDLLNFLGVEKCYLLGLSLGGAIALDFTLEYAHLVDALVLVGTSVNGAPLLQLHNEAQIQARKLQEQPLRDAMSVRNIPALVEGLMNNPTLVPSPEYASARERAHQYLSEYSFAWLLDPAPRQELDPFAWERLHEIQIPTLIMEGEQDDFLLHRIADHLEREITGAQRVTIARTHHMPNMERPEEFNELVLRFLRNL